MNDTEPAIADPSALLRDLLDPAMNPLDMCDLHDLALADLNAWLKSPKVVAALDALRSIESTRASLIALVARRRALESLADAAALAPHSTDDREIRRAAETRRKAASAILRSLPTSQPPKLPNTRPPELPPLLPQSENSRASPRASAPRNPPPTPPTHNFRGSAALIGNLAGIRPRHPVCSTWSTAPPPAKEGIIRPFPPTAGGFRSHRTVPTDHSRQSQSGETTMRIRCLAALAIATPAVAQQFPIDFQELDDGSIVADGHFFNNWIEYASSDFFMDNHLRCGTRINPLALDEHFEGVGPAGSPADCTYNNTTPAAEYDPSTGKFRIPVVVHVIQRTDGTGFIPESRVRSQIDVLNEDFLALAGSLGEPGTDVQIEFFLATEDPDGNPTNGITYSTNNTWYNDGGSYWNALHWDTNRYCNIYTNNASGALGYVPDLPQGGIAGNPADRIVALHSAVGRNSPLPPFHLGRTVTHEMGHYLGLWHVFDNGCGSQSCYTTGDRICDTNGMSSPTFGCPQSRNQCGLPAPFHNYMDYSDDICMDNFTPEQARRIRCSLEHYRPNLAQADTGCPADIDGNGVLDADDFFAYLDLFAAGDSRADLTGNGEIDSNDFFAYLDVFVAGC